MAKSDDLEHSKLVYHYPKRQTALASDFSGKFENNDFKKNHLLAFMLSIAT